jgi:hypothetical protein
VKSGETLGLCNDRGILAFREESSPLMAAVRQHRANLMRVEEQDVSSTKLEIDVLAFEISDQSCSGQEAN